ncbi:type I-E CRISPR-associated protein Cse1/CasA [Nocardiopsis sp. NPDC006198]|uniref:type I-E CRISPR-associated protein Cse1/CasA n=1 Tax=Nocardiopsis sp. NPDC006198 TaxID=3154472 RepID=UPI0033A6AFC3
MPAFDLISEPWVSVDEGQPCGLARLLTDAHRLSVQVRGPEYTALMRVLTVLAARISGLDAHTSEEGFAAHRARVLAEGRLDAAAVEDYFAGNADAFDLFAPGRPWMQDPRLKSACPKTSGLWKLAWGRGTPDRPAHFWWGPLDLPIPAAQAVLDLLTQLMFGAGGKVTARETAPGGKRASTAGMGPLRGSVSYHPHGSTLFESLLLGMPYAPRTGDDPAPWEGPLPDPMAPVPAPTGLATLLLGRARHAILLEADPDGTRVLDAWVTWGAQAAEEQVRDPFQLSFERSIGGRAVPLGQGQRPVWRDLPALVDPASAPPAWTRLFEDAPALAVPPRLGLYASGMEQDRGKSRDHDTIGHLYFDVGADLLDADRRTALVERATRAEEALQALEEALALTHRLTRRPSKGEAHDIVLQFQRDAETYVLRAAGPDPRSQALGVWERRIRPHLGGSPEEIAADIKGRDLLEKLPVPPPAAAAPQGGPAPLPGHDQTKEKEEAWT